MAKTKMTKTCEAEDRSIGAILYQGKPLSDWVNDFKGEFTAEQLFRLIRSGIDLGRIKNGLVDEEESGMTPEEFFTEETVEDEAAALAESEDRIETVADLIDGLSEITAAPNSTTVFVSDANGNPLEISELSKKRNAVLLKTQSVNAINEAIHHPEDVVTIGDLIEFLNRNASLNDKVIFRCSKDKTECALFDIHSKGGVTVLDFVPAKKQMHETELQTDELYNMEYLTVADLRKLGQQAYPHNKDAWQTEQILGIVNGNIIDFAQVRYIKADDRPTEGIFYLLDSTDASQAKFAKEKDDILSEKEANMKEGRSWYGGGYGGTGRSYSSFRDQRAPRGAEIGWYSVEQLDPKAKGKMPGWRCGPSNFPFEDLLYPERKYKRGAFVMRNKYIKAGEMSGEKYIALPSYFSAIKNNDQEAINLLKALGIPLDLTFGLDPNDDYSMTYTVQN